MGIGGGEVVRIDIKCLTKFFDELASAIPKRVEFKLDFGDVGITVTFPRDDTVKFEIMLWSSSGTFFSNRRDIEAAIQKYQMYVSVK